MRRPSLVSCIDMPSPMPPNPSSEWWASCRKFQISESPPVVLCIVSLPFRRELPALTLGSTFDRIPDRIFGRGAGYLRHSAHRGARDAPDRLAGAAGAYHHRSLGPQSFGPQSFGPQSFGHRPLRLAGDVGNPDQPDRADVPVRLERQDPPRKVYSGIPLAASRHVDAIAHGAT